MQAVGDRQKGDRPKGLLAKTAEGDLWKNYKMGVAFAIVQCYNDKKVTGKEDLVSFPAVCGNPPGILPRVLKI